MSQPAPITDDYAWRQLGFAAGQIANRATQISERVRRHFFPPPTNDDRRPEGGERVSTTAAADPADLPANGPASSNPAVADAAVPERRGDHPAELAYRDEPDPRAPHTPGLEPA